MNTLNRPDPQSILNHDAFDIFASPIRSLLDILSIAPLDHGVFIIERPIA